MITARLDNQLRQGSDHVHPPQNCLLGALPRESRAQLLKDSQSVELRFGEVLHDADEEIRDVYFPDSSLISVVASAGNRTMEVGLVGKEGMLGVPLILGLRSSRLRALVQGAGKATRVSAAKLRRCMRDDPQLRDSLNRYLYVRFVDLAQSAVCNRFHRVEARFSRLLLMAHDRAQFDSFNLTHQLIAGMLGVRRSGITTAAGILQRRGLITYSRGLIAVLDRSGLEREACPCYEIGCETYEHLLGETRLELAG